MKALAIDLGGSHATCGLVEDNTILACKALDTDRAKSLRAVLPRIAELFRELAENHALKLADFGGVAVGFAGLADSSTG